MSKGDLMNRGRSSDHSTQANPPATMAYRSIPYLEQRRPGCEGGRTNARTGSTRGLLIVPDFSGNSDTRIGWIPCQSINRTRLHARREKRASKQDASRARARSRASRTMHGV